MPAIPAGRQRRRTAPGGPALPVPETRPTGTAIAARSRTGPSRPRPRRPACADRPRCRGCRPARSRTTICGTGGQTTPATFSVRVFPPARRCWGPGTRDRPPSLDRSHADRGIAACGGLAVGAVLHARVVLLGLVHAAQHHGVDAAADFGDHLFGPIRKPLFGLLDAAGGEQPDVLAVKLHEFLWRPFILAAF